MVKVIKEDIGYELLLEDYDIVQLSESLFESFFEFNTVPNNLFIHDGKYSFRKDKELVLSIESTFIVNYNDRDIDFYKLITKWANSHIRDDKLNKLGI